MNVKNLNKLFKFAVATAMSIGMIFSISSNTQKAQADSDLSDMPVVTLGKSLTSSQRQNTINVLTQSIKGQNYTTLNITGNDLVKYLNPSGENFNTSSGVWSSAMIQKEPSGSGIQVKIIPYYGKNNITSITADQYKNAALTAGIRDANIYVTSAIPIDGSGALAGVYAAYADHGNKLNQKQINAAQDEMGTLSGINKDNKNKDGYSDAKLNNAVAGAKQQLGKIGNNVSDSQIRDIVNNQININHLGNTINNNQKEQIIKLLEEIRDSGALNKKGFAQNAGQLSKDLGGKVKQFLNNANNKSNDSNSNWQLLSDLWNKISSFFSSLF